LYAEGTGPNLGEKLKPGHRAVTLSIADTGAVGGFAAPGSVVDVLFRVTPRRGSRNTTVPEATIRLLEGVEVLALGSSSTPGSRSGTSSNNNTSSVTLAVTADQANALKVVEGRGELSLALRNPNEAAIAGTSAKMTLEELLGIKPDAPPFIAEIYRGTSRQTVTFERDQVSHESFGGVARSAVHPASQADQIDEDDETSGDEK
jgi:pilus assembly protein CpaB